MFFMKQLDIVQKQKAPLLARKFTCGQKKLDLCAARKSTTSTPHV